MGEYEPMYRARRRVAAQFKELDNDNDGHISPDDLAAMLREIDPPVWTYTAVKRLTRALDTNKDGVINFEEFVAWAFTKGDELTAGHNVLQSAWKQSGRKRVEDLFDDTDFNGDGVIDRNELAKMLQALDPTTWDDPAVDQLIVALDKDKDSEINFSEFLEWAFGSNKVSLETFVMQPVNIEPPGGNHVTALLVSMYTSSGGWHRGDITIHYTTDGSEPNEKSARYEGPIVVNAGLSREDDPGVVYVKAFAAAKNKEIDNSAVTTEVFRFVNLEDL